MGFCEYLIVSNIGGIPQSIHAGFRHFLGLHILILEVLGLERIY